MGAQSSRVAATLPAFGMMSGMPRSRAACTSAITTPEWTVPTSTSARSRPTSRFTFCTALAGFELVVEADDLQGPPAHPAAALGEVQLEGGGDVLAERREGAREGQHETDAQGLPALGEGRAGAAERRREPRPRPGRRGTRGAERRACWRCRASSDRLLSSRLGRHRAGGPGRASVICRADRMSGATFLQFIAAARAPATSLGLCLPALAAARTSAELRKPRTASAPPSWAARADGRSCPSRRASAARAGCGSPGRCIPRNPSTGWG